MKFYCEIELIKSETIVINQSYLVTIIFELFLTVKLRISLNQKCNHFIITGRPQVLS